MRGGSGAGCWRGRRRGRLRFGGSGGFFGGVGTARTKDGVFGGDTGLGGAELVLFFQLENWGLGGRRGGHTVVGRAERRRAEFWSQDCAVGRYGIVLLSSRGQMGAKGRWEL